MSKPTSPTPTPAAADKPAPALPQDLQAALQTVANVCDSAPVSGPAHRAWQQALDTLAKALLAAQKA
jgi:hypothetical protein